MSLSEQVAKPFDGVKIVPGFAGAYPLIKVGGTEQSATWLSGVYAAAGEPLLIAQIVYPDAPTQNVVIGRAGEDGPREATVTTVPGGSDTITVTASGTNYTATFLTGYAPTVGDRVRLLWQGREVTVLGVVGVTPAPGGVAGSTAPPPAPLNAGKFDATAVDSATYWSGGGWDSIAGGRGALYQGTVYGTAFAVAGSWFYGNKLAELAGATIWKVWFRLPKRLPVGSHNAALDVNFWAHTSPGRPGGDTSRTVGPTPVNIAAGWSPGPDEGWILLPLSFASTLIAGGGISISGDPYMGFAGKPADPASGQLRIEWSR